MSSGERNSATGKNVTDAATLQNRERQPLQRKSPTNTNSRRSPPGIPTSGKPILESSYFCRDYTRPLPNEEDTVVYLTKRGIGLAYVEKVKWKKKNEELDEDVISAQTLELETIPSCRGIRRPVKEVFVVDRGFSAGETVIKFENEFIGDSLKEYMRIPRLDAAIGQVVNVEVRGDVLLLPQKNVVVRNVPLGRNEYTEMINHNSAYNYVLYKNWIGNAIDCVNDVTLLHRGRYRFVLREGKRNGVFLCRPDRSDEMKALVPGECVSIAIRDAIGRFAIWEQKPPKSLTCSRRRRAAEGVRCIIEKIETHSLAVDWITSPSSTTKPPNVIPKSELGSVICIDPSPNPRPGAFDRVKITPDGSSAVVTREQFFTDLAEQFRKSFEKYHIVNKDHSPTQSEASSQLEVDRKIKGSKVARISNSVESKEENSSPLLHNSNSFNYVEPETDMKWEGVYESSSESIEDEAPSNSGRSRVAVVRSLVRQRRKRKHPVQRRRCTPSSPINTAELEKEILNNEVLGEVLLSHTLVDVQWMNGAVERHIPGYSLIPCDPDLDQQDHLPGVLVARKDVENTDSIFGVILSTDCAERSCVVAWFERKEECVEKIAEEKCILFDIMAHPTYKRVFVGNYGVSVNHQSDDMAEMAFQIIADLRNGKQLVRFLNGTERELWPFDILPIDFVDESMSSDDEDDLSISEADLSKDMGLCSVTPDEVEKFICHLGFFQCRKSTESYVVDRERIVLVVERFVVSFPQLENFSKQYSPEDGDARNAEIIFASVMLEASGGQCSKLSKSLVRFAYVMTAVYRSHLLPMNFDIQLLSALVDGYKCGRVPLKNAQFDKDRDEIFSYLYEFINDARTYPEWLPIFHCLSKLFRGYDENSLQIALRSEFYMSDRTDFTPRYLSWDYVLLMANTIYMAYEIVNNDLGYVPHQECEDSTKRVTDSLDKQPRITLRLKASTRQMIKGIDRTSLAATLMAQILDYESWPVENVNLIVNKEIKFLNIPEWISNATVPSAINKTFAAALALLKRFGILFHTTIDGNCIWKDLDFFFSDVYEPPEQVKYATLHEIIIFVRSVDFLNPTLLQRLTGFSQAYSFETVYDQVTHAFQEKFKEVESTYENSSNPPTPERPTSVTVCDRNGIVGGTFQVLDELVGAVPSDVSKISMWNKFCTTLFKEHKVLAENVPDNIHVHAFSNRLDVLHVLIIGPTGTPFETTPFFFKFQLPYDYPEKPPNVTYVAYSKEQLNPNLYQNGKVCTSLLGTWSGQGVETWNPKKSNLLQVLLSIQALILVPEPYFNEAGYENRKLLSEMSDKSRRYNEIVAINSLEYLHRIYLEPPADFSDVIREFVRKSWARLHCRINGWISGDAPPSFPVMNSKGFKVALEKILSKITTAVNAQDGEQMENTEFIETVEQSSEQLYEWEIEIEGKPLISQ